VNDWVHQIHITDQVPSLIR